MALVEREQAGRPTENMRSAAHIKSGVGSAYEEAGIERRTGERWQTIATLLRNGCTEERRFPPLFVHAIMYLCLHANLLG